MKKILIISFFMLSHLLVYGQYSQRYKFITAGKYRDQQAAGKNMSRKQYIVFPDLIYDHTLMHSQTDPQTRLSVGAAMINRQNRRMVMSYLQAKSSHDEVDQLIAGLYYMSDKNFNAALHHLQQAKEEHFIFLKHLLIADCSFQLMSDKSNFQKVVDLYQVAMDNATSKMEKEIVANRIKKIRYAI